MKISVVTVCRNSAGTIRRALDSFCEQDHGDKELIVVDGASTDATLDIVARYLCDHVRLIAEPDLGIYDAMNKGLRSYAGEAVGFLNSDDRFHDPGVLSDIAEGLCSAPIVFGDIDFVSDRGTRTVVRHWNASPHAPGAFRRGWMAPHPSLYVRRSVAEAVGEFDPTFRLAGDYDWQLRAFEVSRFASQRIARTFVDMMIGGGSTRSVRAYLCGNWEALTSRRRWLEAGFVDYALLAKPLRKVPQFFPPPGDKGARS